MSRATMASSAAAGMPGMPSRLDQAPSCMAPPAARHVVLAVLGQRDAEALGVVEGTSHERAVLHAGAVVGEERDAERGQLASGARALAGPTDGDGAGHGDLGHAADAEGEHLRRHAGRVDGWLRVGHGHDGRVAPERGRPGSGLDRLGLLAAGLTQVGVQVDQARADQAARRRRAPARPSAASIDSASRDDVARRRRRRRRRIRPAGPTTEPPRMTRVVSGNGRHLRRARELAARAAGTGWPCARRRRWPPAG